MIAISVIIPMYNTEKYIEECLKSILNNSFSNYEIICVNDGSTDETYEIVQEFAKQYDTITLMNQSNLGQSAARNRALQIAKGKYVYFLDSDDVISPDSLAKLYEYLEKDSLDVLYFSGDTFFDSNNLNEQFNEFSNVYMRNGCYDGCYSGLDLLNLLKSQNDYSVSPCIQIIRKDFLMENKIQFFEGIIHEDNLFSFLVIVNAKRAKCINEVFFHRRVRTNSVMTTDKSYRNLLGYYTCFFEISKYIYHHPIAECYETTVIRILREIKSNTHSTFFAIPNQEREKFYQNLLPQQRILFKSTILSGLESEVRLNNEIQRLQRELRIMDRSLTQNISKLIIYTLRKFKNIFKKIWGKIHG